MLLESSGEAEKNTVAKIIELKRCFVDYLVHGRGVSERQRAEWPSCGLRKHVYSSDRRMNVQPAYGQILVAISKPVPCQ